MILTNPNSYLLLLTDDDMSGSFWLPPPNSTTATAHDLLFNLILYLTYFFVALIAGLMLYFIFRYRAKTEGQLAQGPIKNIPLEITWTAIPVFINVVLFYYGLKLYLNMATPPINAYTVQVVAQKWNWQFTYQNGATDPNLHVPPNQAILLSMNSADVLHSFYMPVLRVHRDIVPARSNITWFQATVPGEYDIYCTQYCGTGHSEMLAKCIVHPSKKDFEKWLAAAGDIDHDSQGHLRSPEEIGHILYRSYGCASCHTIDGSMGTGPTWKDLYNAPQTILNQPPTLATPDYLKESILDPSAKIVRGYQNIMPSYAGRLNDAQLNALIAYIKTLANPESKKDRP